VGQAALWGLIRTARSENPDRFTLVDHDGSAASEQVLPYALTLDEPEVALREGSVRVPRLARWSALDRLAPPEEGGPWRIDVTEAGTLANLPMGPDPDASRPLRPGEGRGAVPAAAPNFPGVPLALRTYPRGAVIGRDAARIVPAT